MHFLSLRLDKIAKLVLITILLLMSPSMSLALHGHMFLKSTFRYVQETMLRGSLKRAQLNYGIVFECRTVSDNAIGKDSHFFLQLGDLTGFQLLDVSKKLALFLHGWNDEGSKDWVQDMLLSWTWFQQEYNVCVVDWGHLSQNDYKSASMSIFDVGLTVAGIIEALEVLKPRRFSRRNVTLAGYSLGAHAAGYAGSVLNGQVEQIIGLDPAGPLFTFPQVVSTEYRLDATDALFVQVLHTSGGTLGSDVQMGHADFYPNGGKAPQPNCFSYFQLSDVRNTNPISCSHSTAAVFFKQSMNPLFPFVGHHCDNQLSYAQGLCANNHRGRFGVHSQRQARGKFFFQTLPQKPFVPSTRARQRRRPLRRFTRRQILDGVITF